MLSLPRGLYFGFFFDYDVSMILREVPFAVLDILRERNIVYWREFRIEHIPNKMFRLTRRIGKQWRGFTVWDPSGWVQHGFAKLITDWQLGTDEERAFVARMKRARSEFQAEQQAEIEAYCRLECKLLAQWARRMIELHKDAGLELRAYCGPGATASAMFRAHGYVAPVTPWKVLEVAQEAYYGGRSEISMIGRYEGEVYSYDINSAYPNALRLLPSIDGARWKHVRDPGAGDWIGFVRVRWEMPRDSCWGPFPMRGARLPTGRCVSLVYPHEGEGWITSFEYRAADRKWVEPLEAWVCEHRGERAFPWVEEVAAQRLAWKRVGDRRQLPFKYGLNSLYGKLSQRQGKSRYRNYVYAAWTTGYVRAMLWPILDAAQWDVALVATDGIVALRPLPLDVGGELGQWELNTAQSAFVVQAGVYWVGEKLRTRGFERWTIDRTELEKVWRAFRLKARYTVHVRRFAGYRLACAREEESLLCQWIDDVRVLRFSPKPRRREDRWVDGRCLTLPAELSEYRADTLFDAMLWEEDRDFTILDPDEG